MRDIKQLQNGKNQIRMLNLIACEGKRLLALVLVVALLIMRSQNTAVVSVVPVVSTINVATTYQWTITGLSNSTACSNCTVTLRFPITTTFNSFGTTSILAWDNSPYSVSNLSFAANELSFALLTDKSNSSFVFQITNVLNPPYQTIQIFNFLYSSNPSLTSTVSYTAGMLTNCTLNYAGVTGQQVSTANVSFITADPILKNRTLFQISYGGVTGVYNSSPISIVNNGNLTCQLSINNGPFTTQVAAVLVSGSAIFKCDFTNVNLTANSQVVLKLNNVVNPPFTTNYLSGNFQVDTSDGFKYYDTVPACTLSPVTADTYSAVLDKSLYIVNSVYSNPALTTTNTISKSLLQNDQIHVIHNGIEIPVLGQYIMLVRPVSQNKLQYNFVSGTSSTDIVVKNSNAIANSETDQITLMLTNFNLLVPPSASPLKLTFKFYRNSLQYMEIYTILTPSPAIFTTGDLYVAVANSNIGNKSDYTFTVNTSQPLGPNALIQLDLPLEINLNSFTPTSMCLLSAQEPNIQTSCSINDPINKILYMYVNSTGGISAQVLTITLGDINNPSNPQKAYAFGIQSYYSQADLQSKVELGSSLYSYTYTYRMMNIVTSNAVYTVNQSPATFTLLYVPGVDIPSNIKLVFIFSGYMSSIVYKNISINGVPFIYGNSQVGQQITLVVGSMILASSSVVFNFEFKAPPSVSYYNAVTNIFAISDTNVYYEMLSASSPLAINVLNPATQVFTITSLTPTTGLITNYTINFYTNVYHPSTFYLAVTLPSDVYINVSVSKCAPSTVCKGIINTSIGTVQQVYLNISASTTGNTYSIVLTNLTNSRTVGFTGAFTFITYTNYTAGNAVINGTAAALISTPNLASASFDLSKSYYKSNLEPVSIITSWTNKLTPTDFIRVYFDYRTYTVANNNTAGILCATAICSYDATLSTPFTTVIKIIPNSLNQPISFAIQGLCSSSSTYITQQFQVMLSSYSSGNRQMDQGYLTYNLSCRSTTALINKNCQLCNEQLSTCLTCYTGYYLYNSSCVTSCASASTYMTYPGSNICVTCLAPCLTCISATQCLSCSPNIYLYENASCLAQCGSGYYKYTNPNSQIMCMKCWSSFCIKCSDGGSASCTDCGTAFLQSGRCLNTCDTSSYYVDPISFQCTPCDPSCNGCNGRTNAQCIACRPGYYNVSGVCSTSCPTNTVVLSDNTCGCEGNCSTCSSTSTHCLSCLNSTYLLYNSQCMFECPFSSYRSASTCLDCNQGCLNCTATTCVQCLTGYNVYQSKCYTDCNTLGERFAAINGTCLECPTGCDLCDASLTCSVCLANYTLSGSTCILTCQLTNSCQVVDPVPARKLPIPGFITASVWLIILVILKLFILKKIYVPYSFMFACCLVEYVLVIVILANQNSVIKSLLASSASRLLQTTSKSALVVLPQNYQFAVIGLLATSLALNYLANFVYLFLFCKYLKKYIPDRQIDKISNYLVLTLGTLTNFRFSLLAYSKLFQKPYILVQNQSKLTPLHYMCIGSLFTALLPLTAAGILIYNEVPLTNLFMMGVDLLIIVLLELIFTMWIVSVDKPDDYFESTRKYVKQQFNQTIQGLNEKPDTNNASKTKIHSSIHNIENSVINVEEIEEPIIYDKDYLKTSSAVKGAKMQNKNNKSDNQNQPLPNIPIRSSQANLQAIKIRSKKQNKAQEQQSDDKQGNQIANPKKLGDQKTLRNTNNKTEIKKINSKIDANNNKKSPLKTYEQLEGGIKSKIRETTNNFGKQKKPLKAKINKEEFSIKSQNLKNENNLKNTRKQQASASKQQIESQYFEQDVEDFSESTMKQVNSDIMKRERKVLKSQTQRSTLIMPATMKKKQSFGVFQSQKANSQIDQIDFDNLIQTKMIDKTKDKQKSKTISNEYDDHHEEISPSWFNQQNQRFDFDENNSQN